MLLETEVCPQVVEEGLKLISAPQKRFEAQEGELYPFHTYHLAEALKLKEIAKLFDLKPAILNPTCLVYELSAKSYCFLYNFGTALFFNVGLEAQQSTLKRIQNFIQSNQEPVAADEFLLEEKHKSPNTVSFDKVVVDKLTRQKVEILALVLAQSTALEFFENKVDAILNKLGLVLSLLRKKKGLNEKKIVDLIEQVMATKQNLIGTLYLLEKPDETWENKTLDDLHHDAVVMFELKERFRILDYKLKTIQENLEVLSNFATNRQHLFLETTIVALIVVEVALFCFDLFWK